VATFKEIAESLDAALRDLQTKKSALDAANVEASKANDSYMSAISVAQNLKQQLTSSLEPVLPDHYTSNVKVMTPRSA